MSQFFEKLAYVRDKYNFAAAQIWNVDETGVTTVQRVSKVVAVKGTKQVGGITSSERGVLVTLCVAVNAIGNCIPPMFLFPRKKFQDHFIRDGPPGSIGAANGSGWMMADQFYKFIEHFVFHVKPTKENPVLLMLDNHESHLAIKTINYAKDNGVVMLSFPPHCSHRLQPLDRSVYGPFKKYLSSAQDSWLRNNPGKSMTIYDVPSLVRISLPLATTPINIMKGFSVSGIEPYNRDIFSDDDFLPAVVTDQPIPSTSSHRVEQESIASTSAEILNDSTSISTSQETLGVTVIQPKFSRNVEETLTLNIPDSNSSSTENTSKNKTEFSPEVIRPDPKAKERKITMRGRRKRKSAVLTDTPEKNALEEQNSRKFKKDKSIKKENVKNVKKKLLDESDESSEEECFCLVCTESYSNSKPNEEWIMCSQCKMWSHEACTNGNFPYICHNCDSDG